MNKILILNEKKLNCSNAIIEFLYTDEAAIFPKKLIEQLKKLNKELEIGKSFDELHAILISLKNISNFYIKNIYNLLKEIVLITISIYIDEIII